MKKVIKDYDPKKGFGYFAEIMNANAALDMKQQKNKNAVILPQGNEQKNTGGDK